jgi:hypothetical protein
MKVQAVGISWSRRQCLRACDREGIHFRLLARGFLDETPRAVREATAFDQSPMGCWGVIPCNQATLPRILRKAR